MADVEDLSQIGLADLIHQLVTETFEAVSSAQLTQQRQRAEVAELVARGAEGYAASEVDDADVDELLAGLFPSTDFRRPHAIYRGSPYRLRDDPQGEAPPIFDVTGVELVKGDFGLTKRQVEKRLVLLRPGVEKVRRWARLKIADDEIAALRELIRSGPSGIAIHRGSLTLKVTYSLVLSDSPAVPKLTGDQAQVDDDTSRTEDPAAGGERPKAGPETTERPVRPQLRQRLRGALRDRPGPGGDAGRLRLAVRPADPRRSEVSRLAVDVFGDIRLEFVQKD